MRSHSCSGPGIYWHWSSVSSVTDTFSMDLLWCIYSGWCQTQGKRAVFPKWVTPDTSSYSMAWCEAEINVATPWKQFHHSFGKVISGSSLTKGFLLTLTPEFFAEQQLLTNHSSALNKEQYVSSHPKSHRHSIMAWKSVSLVCFA